MLCKDVCVCVCVVCRTTHRAVTELGDDCRSRLTAALAVVAAVLESKAPWEGSGPSALVHELCLNGLGPENHLTCGVFLDKRGRDRRFRASQVNGACELITNVECKCP